MRRLVGILVLILVLVVSVWAVRLLWLTGTFRRITPHFAGTCRTVHGPVGPEDITRWMDVAIDPSGDIIVVGRGPSDLEGVMRRYDDAGVELWTATWDGNYWGSVRVAPNGHFVVGGLLFSSGTWVIGRRAPDDGSEFWTSNDVTAYGGPVAIAPSGRIHTVGRLFANGGVVRAYTP